LTKPWPFGRQDLTEKVIKFYGRVRLGGRGETCGEVGIADLWRVQEVVAPTSTIVDKKIDFLLAELTDAFVQLHIWKFIGNSAKGARQMMEWRVSIGDGPAQHQPMPRRTIRLL
jgi:hypothetical protein